LLISSQSVNKHGCHRKFFFSGWSISKNLLWNCLAKWTKTWWEAPLEGSVLSFLKAEWKVSDTGSAHWASSYVYFQLHHNRLTECNCLIRLIIDFYVYFQLYHNRLTECNCLIRLIIDFYVCFQLYHNRLTECNCLIRLIIDFYVCFQLYHNRLTEEIEANKQYCDNIISQTETLKMISSMFGAMFGVINFEVWHRSVTQIIIEVWHRSVTPDYYWSMTQECYSRLLLKYDTGVLLQIIIENLTYR
jgi:hypothetical protein